MQKKRFVILDALRGFAILGIILANYPEFSLWTFSDQAGWTSQDRVVRAVQTFLVDGKFYTLFSLLFGMGFSIQLSNAEGRLSTFYRRMSVLLVIGLLHLCFLWSGDILMLYAACGMLLPAFRKLPSGKILFIAGGLLLLPTLLDAVFGSSLADPLEAAQWRICGLYGITGTNFGTWLADAGTYREVLQFLHQGAVERLWEIVSAHRFFKVLGLFLIGFVAGMERIYADIPGNRGLLGKLLRASPSFLTVSLTRPSGGCLPRPDGWLARTICPSRSSAFSSSTESVLGWAATSDCRERSWPPFPYMHSRFASACYGCDGSPTVLSNGYGGC